ncbi:MAG: hypothetical protein A3G75_01620 [Verrucomicrobia bacterium RIFCSPLOWO2_12_FULL_64_8]|nr:MAG: hypothetical protein A3G75_01620 [Verrucomicrobia bacterium RIFCSPLOWO2_12_FULL_64_8]
MPTADRFKLIACFAAVYLIWGSTYLAIRVAVATIPPFLMMGTRFLLAGALIAGWLAATRGLPATARQWRDNAIVGAALLLGGTGLVAWAEQQIPSGIATLIISVGPLFFVLLEWAHPRGHRPTALTFFGLALGFGGLLLLVSPGNAGAQTPLNPARVVGLVFACISWAAGSIYSRHLRAPADPMTGAAIQMLMGGVWLTLVAIGRGEVAEVRATLELGEFFPASAVWAWLYLVVAGSLVAFPAYVWLLKHTSAARASTYAYVNPVVAVFLGWLILHETVTARTLVAAAVIIAAVAIITYQKGRTPEPAVQGRTPPLPVLKPRGADA